MKVAAAIVVFAAAGCAKPTGIDLTLDYGPSIRKVAIAGTFAGGEPAFAEPPFDLPATRLRDPTWSSSWPMITPAVDCS